jgi:hypothetical protein
MRCCVGHPLGRADQTVPTRTVPGGSLAGGWPSALEVPNGLVEQPAEPAIEDDLDPEDKLEAQRAAGSKLPRASIFSGPCRC